ncbi:hypothetical protein Aazo_0059 ['Nostoc azollae' 0708]|jgi:hypothetical protein|uniref:Uncharacterized protein n=1 Tax=Nostoc azollae (strain 0708) TaxID=551115 RepID=D7DVD8_NOSA0|nr:hypothetical protein Aazo_0059 ['Nostoc azollae' 0708]
MPFTPTNQKNIDDASVNHKFTVHTSHFFRQALVIKSLQAVVKQKFFEYREVSKRQK